jgi:N-acetyl sugar amidotransferase
MNQTVKTRQYQICSRCVMDTTDPDIVFDENGICNHCHTYDDLIRESVFLGAEGKRRLEEIVRKIKKEGKDKKYDCVIGVSGGVDSTYVAYKVKELGLRPLAAHLDNGWDSELAVMNIEQTLKMLNIDLYTHVINWEEFKDLQLSFLKASTPDSEIPSDHAIVSLMYRVAEKFGTKYVLAGYNAKTESHIPSSWSKGYWDWKYIKSVSKQFGRVKLNTYPHVNFWTLQRYRKNQSWIHILNYLDYNKKDAKNLLIKKLAWKDYGWKHHESIYTRFYQGYILIHKFGYDKRRAHLSSLICAGETNRDEALIELQNEPYPLEMQIEDKQYVIKKLNISEEEFENIMKLPSKSFWDYPSYAKWYNKNSFKTMLFIYQCAKKLISHGSPGHE